MASELYSAIPVYIFVKVLVPNFISSVQKVSKRLQNPKLGFHEVSCDLKGLIQILNLKNDEIIHNAIHSVNGYSAKWGIPIARTRRRKMMP